MKLKIQVAYAWVITVSVQYYLPAYSMLS